MLSFEQDVAFFLRRAERNVELDQYWEALQLYRKAMEVAPQDFRVWQGISDTYSNLGCNFTALRCYLGALWNCPTQPGDYEYRLAHKFIAVEEYSLGMRCLRRFIYDNGSGDFVAERTLAEKLIFLWDEASETDQATEEVEDLSAWLQVQVGLSRLREGDTEDGIETLIEAYKSAPGNIDIALVLATSFWPMKRYAEAIEVCNAVIEMEDDNLQAHCLLALIADETGDQALCKHEMQILRSLAYYSPQDIFRAGLSLADLKDHEHAHLLLKEGYQRAPNNVWLSHAYAACSMIVGQRTIAADVYMRTRRLLPQDPGIFYFEQKCARWQGGDVDRDVMIQEFPMVFGLPEADAERLRNAIASHANPFTVTDLECADIPEDELPMLLRWGLEKDDGDWQRLALLLALRMDKETAVSILQAYLVLPDKWCKAKLAACDILFCLGVEEPSVSWTEEGRQQLESRFASAYKADMENDKLPFHAMQKNGKVSDRELRVAVYLWQQFLHLSDTVPEEREYLAYGKGMQLLSKNLCNRGSRILTALQGGHSPVLSRIQEVLEPHFLPAVADREDDSQGKLLFPGLE